jgi:glutamate carboxypeptidase
VNIVNNYLNEINGFIDSKKDEIIDLWKEIVNLESFTADKQSVNVVANRLKTEFVKEGFDVELIDVGLNGNTLVATLGLDRGKEPVIFSGHMDTVFKNNPFRIEGDRAYGPGALDMKGGIVIALYVIKALNSIGYDERPLKVILSGDEESGHEGSTGEKALLDAAKGGSKRLGGSSDASYLTIANVPTICAFGVQGQWNHTVREYAFVDSIFERAKIISTIALNLDKFKY